MCVVNVAHADLREALAAELLEASKADNSMSKKEKLITQRCTAVKRYLVEDKSALRQALYYSCSAPVVGVAFYAGNDLGQHSPEKIAVYIENMFAENGMRAKVFIKHNHQSGSSVAYMIMGGRRIMNPKDPVSAISRIEGFAADAKLVFFVDGKISSSELEKWVKSESPYVPNVS